MKKNKGKLIIILTLTLLLTGCTTTLKDENKKVVINPDTGQSLTKNILCQPENKETLKLYKENKLEVGKLPMCDDFKITTGGYEGLWESIFVKPLAFIILKISSIVKSSGLALIITSILIRLVAYPITKKTAMQSELIKKAQPELNKLEQKYKNKNDQDSMMKKGQEMTMIYKKYNINPISGCIFGIIQLPLFIAFLEAINRVPAIFEEKFLTIQMGTTPAIGLASTGNILYLILIALVAYSTYLSFNLNKSSAVTTEKDPMKGMTTGMVIMFTVMGFFMPAALCIYWITTNLFTIVQNLIVKRSKI